MCARNDSQERSNSQRRPIVAWGVNRDRRYDRGAATFGLFSVAAVNYTMLRRNGFECPRILRIRGYFA
jgi:hypothetical protein